MDHVGIDLGSVKSDVCALDTSGALRVRVVVATRDLGEYLKRFKGRVVMESCTQSRKVAEHAQAAGLEVVVVPGTFVRQLGVGARGIKTDAKDAECLARASLRNADLPNVRSCCARSRDHRRLLRARQQLVQMRTRCVASIKSYLRGELIVLRGRAVPATFIEQVESALLARPEGIPLDVSVMLETIAALQKQIEELDATLLGIARSDQVCRRLMTIPGVGPIVSLAFASMVDDVGQFPTAEHLASYLALVPGEHTTGGKIKRTGVIKAGPSLIRGVLVQAAWSTWRTKPDSPLVQWAKRISERKGKKVAIVALARKLSAIMYAMWKNERNYEPRLPSPPLVAQSATN